MVTLIFNLLPLQYGIMAEKEALKIKLDHSIVNNTPKGDTRTKLLTAGWPQALVDEYLGKIAKKVKRLEQLPTSALIMLNNVSKKFDSKVVLENVNLEIVPGEVFGIIGLSGTGKTTLLNLIVGFLEPDAGDIVVKLSDGSITSITKSPELVKTLYGFSTQNTSFYGKLTVRENLQHFGSLYGINPVLLTARINDLVELVGLKDSADVIAQHLSGGMQKRLDIACAMIHEPRVLILDEPTADLDPLLRKQMWNLIGEINKRGTTIIVASHFVSEIEDGCDRVAVLSNRTVSKIGTVEELIDVYSKDYALQVETKAGKYDSLIKGISKIKSISSYQLQGNSLMIKTKNPKQTVTWLSNYIEDNKDKIVRFNLSRPSLGEVFESLVSK